MIHSLQAIEITMKIKEPNILTKNIINYEYTKITKTRC